MHSTHICESGVLVKDGIAAGGALVGGDRQMDRSLQGCGGLSGRCAINKFVVRDQFGETLSIYRIDMYD